MNLGDLNQDKKKTIRVKPKKNGNPPRTKKEKTPKASRSSGNSPTARRKLYFDIAIGVSICGFALCVGSLIWYNLQAATSKKTFSKYAPSVVTEDGEDVESYEKNKELTFVNVKGVWVWDKYVDAYLKNPDCIGWLNIPDTVIDYPVAYSMDEPTYYLHRDLDKNYSFPGTIFIDSDANIDTLSNNVTIYGHHMRNGSMFASLEEYESEKYYNKHKTIYLDTINGHYTYEVVSAFRISTDDDFKYASFNEAEKRDDVKTWLDGIMSRSYIKDTYATVDDKFITLSTCDYHQRNGRFVVVARQIDSTDSYQSIYITLDEYRTLHKSDK